MLKQHQNKEAYPPTILLVLHTNKIRSQPVSYLVQQYAVKQTAISNYSQNPLKLLQQTTMHCKRSLFASQHYHSLYIIFNIKSKIQKTTQKYNAFQSTKHKGVQPCTPEFILSLFVFPYINFNNI